MGEGIQAIVQSVEQKFSVNTKVWGINVLSNSPQREHKSFWLEDQKSGEQKSEEQNSWNKRLENSVGNKSTQALYTAQVMARMYLQPRYGNGVFSNVYFSAGQKR